MTSLAERRWEQVHAPNDRRRVVYWSLVVVPDELRASVSRETATRYRWKVHTRPPRPRQGDAWAIAAEGTCSGGHPQSTRQAAQRAALEWLAAHGHR